MIEEEDYTAFGSDLNHITEKYKYTGKEKDITGLYYYGVRYYDPTIGRFTTRDPEKGDIMNPQSLNPYVYCMNNPMKYIDPNGLKPIDWPDEIPYRGPSKDYSEEIEEYMEEKLQEINSSSGRKHKYRTWRGIKYDAPESPINSWGVEVTFTDVYFSGAGGGIGSMKDENGKWVSYWIEETEGFGFDVSVDFSIFFSSSSTKEVANSESIGFENSGAFLYFQSSSSKPGIDKFNIGVSIGSPLSGAYWSKIKTSQIPQGVIQWIKEHWLW